MQRFFRLPALAFATIVTLAGTLRAANPLENRVPKDAIFYLGWSGADAQKAAYNASNLKSFVDASTAPQFVSQELPKALDMAGKLDRDLGKIIPKVQDGLNIAWHHPAAFYFCPITLDNPRQPQFRFGILCDAGSDADKLLGLLSDATAGLPKDPNFHVTATIDGNLVGLIFGKEENAAERQKDGTLSANPAYAKAMAHFKSANPAVAMYFNLNGTITMATDILNKMPNVPPDARTKINQALDMLGLNQFSQMAAVEGFEGKEWASQAFVGVAGEPKGLVKMLASQPISSDALAMVPKNAAAFTASRFDLKATYQEMRSFITAMDARVPPQLDAALADLKKSTGIDAEQDIVNALGDEWVLYRAPLSSFGGNNTAMVQRLRDPERFTKAMATLEQLVNRATEGKFKIDHMTESKIEFSTITILNFSLAWTVRNGYLYISSMEGLPGAVKQVENKLPNITQSDLYTKAIATAGGANVKPTSITYTDPGKLYPDLRRMILGLLPLARLMDVDIPPSILPDPEVVAPIMTPGVTITWWDADGMHLSGRSSFPGAEIVGTGANPGTIVALGALGTGVMLPSLAQARQRAMTTVDATNLKAQAMYLAIYAAQNNDKLPDDIAQAVADEMTNPMAGPRGSDIFTIFVNRRSGTTPLVLTPELQQLSKTDFPKFAAALAEHNDYVYIGKGLKGSERQASRLVIAYDKPGPWVTDGMNMAFDDGHVEFVRLTNLAQTFEATNLMRKEKELPPVDVTAILRACGVPATDLRNLP